MSHTTSEKKSAAARANGAKSKGPATPSGRARSAQNSFRHGLRSQHVVTPGEDPELFEQHRAAYIQRFQPADQPEMDLVETLAAARWRINRIIHIEGQQLTVEQCLHNDEIDRQIAEIDDTGKQAWVFNRWANHDAALGLLLRYESQLNRIYDRSLKQLQTLQNTRPPAPPPAVDAKMPNEPKLVPIPAPAPPPDGRLEVEQGHILPATHPENSRIRSMYICSR